MLVVIPARAGSQRIPNKALRRLGKHPLLAYTIASAQEAQARCDPADVIVASEDDTILDCARHYGAVTWRRPASTATADAPDITWLRLFVDLHDAPTFMLLRLTSPFITASTMARAWADFLSVPEATSMRGMRPVTEHPNKMWRREGRYMVPIFTGGSYVKAFGVEAWSTPTQQLATVYVQTAGLEILKAETIRAGSLTGDKVLPWFFSDEQGLDINTPQDWWMAEQLVEAKAATLPDVPQDPWVQHD